MQIEIQEPWWGAAKTFGWAKGIWGVGFKAKDVIKAIENGEQIIVKIYNFKDTYTISPTTVKNYAIKNSCTYLARHGTKLFVVPSTELRKYESNKGGQLIDQKSQVLNRAETGEGLQGL